jgi:propanol-preferring alcohol dehydrogenase
MTIGHEVAGVVVAVGERVVGLAAGDRVGVRSGPGGAGWAYHGGFTELMAAPAEHVVKAPEHVPFSHLAVGDAGMVAHHAVARLAGAAPGVRMGIIGLGGLACSGLQIAAMLGASVYAAEPRTVLHERASACGAIEVFSDAARFAGLELDVIVDFAGYSSTAAAAVATVGVQGTVILVGAGDAASTINTWLLVKNRIHLSGHHGADADDLRAYWDFLSHGLDPVVTEISFDEIGEGIDRLRRRDVIGRLVAVLDEDLSSRQS